MGAVCCGVFTPAPPPLTEEEKRERRERAAQAATERGSRFAQGGGGESLRNRSRRADEAQAAANSLGNDGKPNLNDPRAWD